jgi:regulator of protease activity HflC (stomatin/prohibitin superfamily)
MRDSAAGIVQATVADYQRGLLLVDGELKTLLAPGSYAFWAFQREVQVELVDTRLQVLEVAGQEILTKDKVSLRLNLSAHFRVKNPVQVRAELGNYKDYLYRELQFGLRQAVGSRSLDELLADKEQLDGVVATYAQAKVAVHGVELVSVGVKDIILPGEMKTILNQVVEADKAAQANVIRRREETAATRSLLNTARLMDENPTLLRLKELEALEKVTGKIDKLTVFGGLEGVLSGLVSLRKA